MKLSHIFDFHLDRMVPYEAIIRNYDLEGTVKCQEEFFFISVQQIIESEKIRLVSLLKHSGVTLAKIITNDNLKESIEGIPLSCVLNLIAPSILKCQTQSHR